MADERWDYFDFFVPNDYHPFTTSTGSYGRCDNCGFRENPLHNKPFGRKWDDFRHVPPKPGPSEPDPFALKIGEPY